MTQDDFLRRIVAHLDEAGAPYMVAGSVASSYYGAPRSTNDIDIVVDPESERVSRFVEAIYDACYVSRAAVLEALRERSLFNVIDYATGWKGDFIVRKDRPFSLTEFERRGTVTYLGIRFDMATPEDVILSKLEWSKLSESERQLRDAAGVYDAMRESLDRDYLERWAAELDVVDRLRRIESFDD